MSELHPFRALRPDPAAAPSVASVPYDVVNADEARALAAGNPLSFLHVTRSEIDLPTGTSPYGPFTVRGKVLEPVLGWTNHHSIVELQGKWYLFYHDAQLSKGQTHLRNIKVTELKHRADGSIETIDAYRE